MDGIMSQGPIVVANSKVNADSKSGTVYGIYSKGTLNLANSEINISSEKENAFGIDNWMEGKIENTTVNVNSDAKNTIGISNATGIKITLANVNVFADAISSDGPNNSIGITNHGEMMFYSGSVYGLHSGLQNSAGAKLYVYGGTFDGYGHGGIYFAQGPNGEAYVENATLKSGEYKGQHDESKFSLSHGGSFYIGGGTAANNSNNKVYMNGCTITSVKGTMGVLRGSDGETNNQLYISNSTIENGKKMRIDENQKLFVGKGTNITEANVSSVDRVEFTNEEYKR